MDSALAAIGGVPVYAFPVALDAGMLLALVLGVWLARRDGLPVAAVLDTSIVALLGALVGARGAYVAMHASSFAAQPLSALSFWEGGLSLPGAITFGGAAAAVWLRRSPVSPWRVLDALAPAIAFGQCIGMLGCAASGCVAGIVPPGGSRLPVLALPNAGGVIANRFPSALVESACCLVTGLCLLGIRRGDPQVGVTAALYLVAYALVRLALEPLRADSVPLGPFAFASWWAGAASIAGASALWQATRKQPHARRTAGPARA